MLGGGLRAPDEQHSNPNDIPHWGAVHPGPSVQFPCLSRLPGMPEFWVRSQDRRVKFGVENWFSTSETTLP